MPFPPAKTATPELGDFRRRLLGWFHRRKRDLPWRRTHDPYRVWISEIMLQQTRVAAVLPYYRQFLARFPNVRRLASAPLDRVLERWAGLGYYSRARNLHRAAKEILARHGGRFPHEYQGALALPGIGQYTAAAVLSIAYAQPYAVLDGNVARVLARLGAIRGDLRSTVNWRRLQATAQELLTRQAPGDWNQAMMELGATVCTPRAPRCPACPVSRWCRAYRLNLVDRVPTTRRQRSPLQVHIAAAVLLDPRGRTLLVKDGEHTNGTLFSRMWQFPAIEANRTGRAELARHIGALLDGETKPRWEALPLARHTVTYRAITLAPFLVRVAKLPRLKGARMPRLVALDQFPTSSATRKIAAAALRQIAG